MLFSVIVLYYDCVLLMVNAQKYSLNWAEDVIIFGT